MVVKYTTAQIPKSQVIDRLGRFPLRELTEKCCRSNEFTNSHKSRGDYI